MTSHQTASDICNKLVRLFTRIETEKMDGVPVLNKNLHVEAIGFDRQDAFHLGVLLTPWFMNLLLIPADQDSAIPEMAQVGSKHLHALPAGRFEFILAHEDELGKYLSCSLFSPVFEFADQTAAVETAQAVLQQVLCEADETKNDDDDDEGMREIWAGRLPSVDTAPLQPDTNPDPTKPATQLSRRELLRGARKSTPEEPLEQRS